jgi:hypothetical protein
VIEDTANDIRANYETILTGDIIVWKKIEKLVMAPKEKKAYLP